MEGVTVMREIQPARLPADPGRVFYTIRPEDVGKGIIDTEIGPIAVSDVLGRVQPGDVGKRLYRVPTDGGLPDQPLLWYWQAENNQQRDARLARDTTPTWRGLRQP
jgi:hypothetical protein